MLSIQNDDLISLNDACRLLPKRRGGKRPHVATLFRWASVGCRGIRLETVQIGGTKCTSRAALDRFFARLSQTPAAPASNGPPAAAQLDAAQIKRELDKEGL